MKRWFMIFLVIMMPVAVAEMYDTPYGPLEVVDNSDTCDAVCNFELILTASQTIVVPVDLTFNNKRLDWASVSVNGQEAVSVDSSFDVVERNYMYEVCDEVDGDDCLASHEEEGVSVEYVKKLTTSSVAVPLQSGQEYVIVGSGRKSALADTKWSFHLGDWVLDPPWDSSWNANGSVNLSATSSLNLTSDNVTVNVTWDGDNSSFKYIYNWFKDDVSLTVLNMPFERINGTASDNAHDYSLGNSGNVSGAVWTADGYDGKGAYSFDGVNDFVSIPSEETFDFVNSTFSVSGWFKNNNSDNAREIIVGKGGTSWNYQWDLELDSGNKLNAFFHTPSGSTIYGKESTDVVSDNLWHHFVAVFDTNVVSENVTLYLDGVEQTIVSYDARSTKDYGNAGNPLHIGAWGSSGSPALFFNGTIDEVVVWNRSLSLEQALALYNNETHIVSQETVSGEVWNVSVTPNDGHEDGAVKMSNSVRLQVPPSIDSVVLNTTDPSNETSENVTVHVSTSDVNGNSVKVIYNWYLNDSSISVLNMPFERVNGTSSNNAHDYSQGNNGSVVGAVWGSVGYDGKGAYDFDGVNDYNSFAREDRFDFLNSTFTVSGWFKNNNSDTAREIIVGKGGTNNNYQWDLELDSGNKLNAFFHTPSGSTIYGKESTHVVSDNLWHHFVAVYDTNVVSENITLYLDGVEQTTVAYDVRSTKDYGNAGNPLHIGVWGSSGSPALFFNGSIDEIVVWNRSLSAEQISALYENKTDLIVSQETSVGNIWNVSVTPNDGIEDGVSVMSDSVTILPEGGIGPQGGGETPIHRLNLSYDANGNLISGDGFRRTYNSLNQLSEIRNSSGGLLESFTYHPTEERVLVKKVYSGGALSETVYYFDENFVRVVNSSGSYDFTYVIHEGQRVAQEVNGNKKFIHNDHLGSTSIVTDQNGDVVENTLYSPSGEILSGGVVADRQYEGKEFSRVTGDYDFHFRRYRPDWMLYTKPDDQIKPYDPQQLNRYMFERGNAYKYTDEDGHEITLATSAFITSAIWTGLSYTAYTDLIALNADPQVETYLRQQRRMVPVYFATSSLLMLKEGPAAAFETFAAVTGAQQFQEDYRLVAGKNPERFQTMCENPFSACYKAPDVVEEGQLSDIVRIDTLSYSEQSNAASLLKSSSRSGGDMATKRSGSSSFRRGGRSAFQDLAKMSRSASKDETAGDIIRRWRSKYSGK